MALFRKQTLGHIGVDKLLLENICNFYVKKNQLLRWTHDDPIVIPDCKDQGTQTEEEICGRTAPILGPHPSCRMLIQLQQLSRALVASDPFVAWPTPAFSRMEKKRSADAMENVDLQGPRTALEQFHIIIGAALGQMHLCFCLQEPTY